MTNETEPCPTCEGEKVIYLRRMRQIIGKPGECWYQVKKCPTCGGEGGVRE